MTCDKKHFKFFCQTVLPIVYDDSLSFQELLYKMIRYINGMKDDIENISKDMVGYIRDHLDDIFIDAMYDAETETLILILNMEEGE